MQLPPPPPPMIPEGFRQQPPIMQLPPPIIPGGFLQERKIYFVRQTILLMERHGIENININNMYRVFPHFWQDGTPICLMFEPDRGIVRGIFEIVMEGFRCTTCFFVSENIMDGLHHVLGNDIQIDIPNIKVVSLNLGLDFLFQRINLIYSIYSGRRRRQHDNDSDSDVDETLHEDIR